jgi:uncharacterized protein YdhG (YjbR/CyaY superfamily)
MTPANQEPDDYFDAVPPRRKALVEQLHGLILSLYPEARVDLSYRMPTYRVGDGWVAVANQQHDVSLYTFGAQHLADFRAAHPEIRTGKGCITLAPDAELPVAAVTQVIRHAIEHPEPA